MIAAAIVLASTIVVTEQVDVAGAGAGTVELMSVGPDAGDRHDFALAADITADGQGVLFISQTLFLPGASFPQLWLHRGAETIQISANLAGTGAVTGGISDNGRFVAFVSTVGGGAGLVQAVHLADLTQAGSIRLFDVGDTATVGATTAIDVSDDGRYLVFDSIVAHVPEDTNGVSDVYRFDVTTQTFDLISTAPDGTVGDGPSTAVRMDPTGRVVVFGSTATNLIGVDTNGASDVFVWTAPFSFPFDPFPRRGTIVRASTDATGAQLAMGARGAADISDQGRYVVFISDDQALDPIGFPYGKVVRKDLWTQETDVLSGPTSVSPTHVDMVSGPYGRFWLSNVQGVSISGDGWEIAADGDWTWLSRGPQGTYNDVVVYDLSAERYELMSPAAGGGEATDGQSTRPVLSADGTAVAFTSFADLTADTGVGSAVFRSTRTPEPAPVELSLGQGATGGDGFLPRLAGQTTDTIDFDADGLADGTPLLDRYAAQGVQLTGLVARATNDFTHSPPFGAQASGFNTPSFTGDFSIDVSPPVSTFGFWTWDVEADIVVGVHRTDGTWTRFPIRAPLDDQLFIGLSSGADDIDRITVNSPGDLFIIDDLVWGRGGAGGDPSVTITEPADGASYTVDQVVATSYECTDDAPGVACDGDLPNGSPLDTSTPGTFSFSVTATDTDGRTASATHTYHVVPAPDGTPPTIQFVLPTDGAVYAQGESVGAAYECFDEGGGSGLDSCTGQVPRSASIDTSTLGRHTFQVTARDLAGNETTETVTYEVASGDVDAPSIWITRPSNGVRYPLNAAVAVEYHCDDGLGTGVVSCEGFTSNGTPIASGSPLPTSVAGDMSFRVEARDAVGNVSSQSVSYAVGTLAVDTVAPYIIVSNPLPFARVPQGAVVPLVFRCADIATPASAVTSCTANPSTVDTGSVGTKAITFTTTDAAGNARSGALFYEVIDDPDGDGLTTLWETQGIDADGNGSIDLQLAGADPAVPDLYVEMDWMSCALPPSNCAAGDRLSQAPQPGSVDDVVAAFAANGVRLHLQLDEAVPEVKLLRFQGRGAGALDDFDDFRLGPTAAPCDGTFGTLAERADPNCPALIRAKAQVYRYGLWAYSYVENPGSSGIAELPGNDFMVTTGNSTAAWTQAAGSLRVAEAGTLMHELGHTLGLGHGGRINGSADATNCKPNYLSVMSYTLQVPNYDPTRPLDFSGDALPDLLESSLDEQVGVQGPSGRNVVIPTASGARAVPAAGSIDWNRNGTIDVSRVSADINSIGFQCFTPSGETLRGADDWANLLYGFTVAPDFAPGSRTSVDALITEEITSVDAVRVAAAIDTDGDGVANLDDLCDTTTDPTNRDTDGDRIGDACDDDTSVGLRLASGNGRYASNQTVKVAVLARPGFSPATDLVVSSVRFGRVGTEASLSGCDAPTDVNRDGRLDVVCSFKLKPTTLAVGPAVATLTGRTTWGEPVRGTVAIEITK